MQRVKVVVSGHVQGVFFRATCAREARRRGVAGHIRNLPNGDVEAVFEGPDDEVGAMVAWCRRGTDLARVDLVATVEEEPVGDVGFHVDG